MLAIASIPGTSDSLLYVFGREAPAGRKWSRLGTENRPDNSACQVNALMELLTFVHIPQKPLPGGHINYQIIFEDCEMRSRILIPFAQMRDHLAYDETTGDLTWTVPTSNRIRPGALVRTLNTQGYYHLSFQGRLYLAHRVAWAMHYGEQPSHTLDHINGNTTDNRIVNLQEVTQSENLRKAKLRQSNTSGHRGVSWFATNGKWRADIRVSGKLKYLGQFDHIDDAVAARLDAELEFFH